MITPTVWALGTRVSAGTPSPGGGAVCDVCKDALYSRDLSAAEIAEWSSYTQARYGLAT